jgi:hypothetical protein
VTSRRRLGIGLVSTLLFWIVAPAVSQAQSASFPNSPIFSDNFSSGSLSPFIENNGAQAGGAWTISNHALVASNVGITSYLPEQVASVPHIGKNVILTTSFTINQLNPGQPYRIGVFGRGSAPGTGISQWDIVLDSGKLTLINQGIGVVDSIPFAVQAGQSYTMVAVIDGTWVGAQLWAQGTAEPSQWTISGTFSKTGNFSSVGVAAGDADVTFQNFAAYSAPPVLTVSPTQPNGVYQSGQPTTYSVTLTANTPNEGGLYDINYILTNLSGTTVGQGTVPLMLPSGKTATTTISLPTAGNGYYTATLSLSGNGVMLPTLSENASTSHGTRHNRTRSDSTALRADQTLSTSMMETTTSSLAVVPNVSDSSSDDSFFGINGPGNQYGPITPTLENRWISVYDLFKKQGIHWVRTQFMWNNVEPSPGTYTWDTSDGLVKAAHAANVKLLGLVDYWGNYANPFNVDGGPQVSFATAVQDYDQYIQALVERYMPGGTLAQEMGWQNYGITTWEIWNEPSAQEFWPSQNPTQYAELVQSASAAIKAVDPNATILAYNWQEPTLLQTAGPSSFTGVSIHEYPGPVEPSESIYYQGILDIRQYLTENGLANDPIWMTETGWSTNQISPIKQAEYLQRAAIQSLAASLNKFFVFTWSYPSAGYGELSGSLQPLPAYAALAAASDELDGYTPVTSLNPLQMGSSIRAFVFQNGPSTLVALWSPTATGTLTLSGASNVSAQDWMGNPISGTGSTLTVPLNGQPVFVTANMPPQELASIIQSGTVAGIAPVSVKIAPVSQLPSTLPSINVTVTNQTNATDSGTLTLNLPSGWEGTATAPASSTTAPSASPSVSFGPLAPGASIQETFNLTRFEASATNQYVISAVAAASPSGSAQASATVTATLTLNPSEVVSGTAGLTGTFSDWADALPLYVDTARQRVDIPDWSAGLASATAYAMWNSQYLYFAIKVTDGEPFFEPYTGSNYWKGDSVQLYIDPTNTPSPRYDAAAGDMQWGFARTPQGNQAYERYPLRKVQTDVKLTVVPGSSNGNMWYEAAIPVSELSDWTAQNGQTIRMNFLVNYNFGNGRVGWMEFAPGVGNAFDPNQFPSFTLVNSAPLASFILNASAEFGDVTFTPNAQGALLTVNNDGLTTINVSLSNGTTLTLNASANASASVTPTGSNPSVPILANGTTTINLANYVTPGAVTTLTAQALSQPGASALVSVDNGVSP